MKHMECSVTDVLTIVGISQSKFHQVVNGRQINVRKTGNGTIIPASDLDDFIQRLPVSGESDAHK